jgi:hypothetical protein
MTLSSYSISIMLGLTFDSPQTLRYSEIIDD